MILRGRRRFRRGQALVVSILGLTILTAAAIALSAGSRLELRGARRGLERVRREAALRGAVERTLGSLQEARRDPEDMLRLLRDYREIRWESLDPGAPADTPGMRVGVQIVDASSRIDVNTASAEELRRLPRLDRETLGAIIDWRAEDEGEDDQDYSADTRPLEPPDRPLNTLEELLQVRGVEAQQFFGMPTIRETRELEVPPLAELLTPLSGVNNVTPDGRPRTDVNRATERELLNAAARQGAEVNEAQMRNLALRREQGTVFTSTLDAVQAAQIPSEQWGRVLEAWTADPRSFLPGRMNVNTASAMALRTLPRVTDQLAASIVARRRERRAGLGWTDLLEMLAPAQARPVEQPTFEQQPPPQEQQGQDRSLVELERRICFQSDAYVVRVLTRVENSDRIDAVQALVYLPPGEEEPGQVVQWRRAEKFPGWTAWYRQPGENEGLSRAR